ncbi:hypothetical protein HY493_03180 [Candidatus Woesearchaeota archaeon]|nr:hypothetical protein [Candidatus Woesearchaeota archaeon]
MDERRKQLRREMDTYISQRRKSEGWSMFKKQAQPALHPTVQPYKKEEPMQAPVETEYEQSKKGWFSGFMNKLFGEEQPSEDVPQSEAQSQMAPSHEETINDLKEIARISLGVMKQMPGEAVREFKATPDYEKFKDILRKHKLIR